MTRNGRTGPPQEAPRQPDDSPERDPELTVHQKGTFPVTGKKVAFSVDDTEPLTGRFRATLTWDMDNSPDDIVVHLAAFLVGKDSKVPGGHPYFCVHHDNDRSKDGSAVRRGRRKHGHNLTNETITVDLKLVDEDVEKVVFVAYVQDANPLGHTFAALSRGSVAFTELPPGDEDPIDDLGVKEIDVHPLDHDYYDDETAIIMGEVLRNDSGDWGYRDIGTGLKGLIEVGAKYGVIFVHGH